VGTSSVRVYGFGLISLGQGLLVLSCPPLLGLIQRGTQVWRPDLTSLALDIARPLEVE
jgi:hypothetical protein